jgi:hypothetical protein
MSLGTRCFAGEENGLEDGGEGEGKEEEEEEEEDRKSLQAEGGRVRVRRSCAAMCIVYCPRGVLGGRGLGNTLI